MRRRAGLAAACVLALAALAGCSGGGGQVLVKQYQPPPTPAPEADPPAETAGGAVVAVSATVRPGDSLWRISRQALGRGARYGELAEANALAAPYLIVPGQVLTLPQGAAAAPRPSRGAKAPAAPAAEWAAKKANTAYAVGEKLTFAVQYFAVTAGYATLSVQEYAMQQGRPCYHVVAEAKTHPFFETFFKVQDRIETFIDTERLVPWRYEKHLREGGFKADSFFVYDQRRHTLTDDRGNGVTMPAETQDVISCFYLYRTLPGLEPGTEQRIRVTADDKKSYELQVKVLRRERVEVLAGKFDCIVVQPLLKFEGVFQQKGEVFIWLTDDARRLPVKIQSKIVIGSINVNLQSAEWVKPQ